MDPENLNFQKNEKNTWRDGVQQTEFFVVLDCFLPFYPHNNPKNQNFEKMKKKNVEILSFYTSVT